MIIGLIQWSNKQVAEQLQKLTGQYCTMCTNLIQYRKRFADALVVTQNKDKTWTIIEWFIETRATYVVSWSGNSLKCTCKGYERDGIACRHMLVLEERGSLLAPQPKPYYRCADIRQALCDTEIVPNPATITEETVLEPAKRQKVGRPATRRYKSITEQLLAERRKSYRCAICKRQGHTAKTHDAWERRQRKRRGNRGEDSSTCRGRRPGKGKELRTFRFDAKSYMEAQQGP